MDSQTKMIMVEINVNASIEKVWKLWTTAEDIMQWNIPYSDWQCPRAETDLKEGGNFIFRMETKNGSFGFDHAGKYDKIISQQLIEYTGTDGRKSVIHFSFKDNVTTIVESFEPDAVTPLDLQEDFCKGVLKNFKEYAETEIK